MLVLVMAVIIGGIPASAQVIYLAANGTYTQNFDTLAGSAWANNSTLTGWYGSLGTTDYTSITTSDASSTLNPRLLLNLGNTADTNRALGSFNAGANGDIFFGVQLKNDTGDALNQFTVKYDGEEWRGIGSAATTSLTVEYQIFAAGTGSISASSGWIGVSDLTFNAPHNPSSSTSYDGTDPANRVANITATIEVDWENGQELWLRWVNQVPGAGKYSHVLGIDNFAFSASAIPEPSTWLLLLAGAGLLLRRHANSGKI